MEQPVPLSMAPVGVRLILAAPPVDSAGTTAERRRLAQFGLRPGAEFVVVMRTSGGGRVVAVAGSRIALDRASAHGLSVLIPHDDRGASASTAGNQVTVAG